MRARPWKGRRLPQGLAMALLAGLLLNFSAPLCPLVPKASHAEELTDVVEYVAPKLSADVDPYDPEHPEDLQEEQLYAKSAILIEASTGKVIFEKNPDERMYPASTTKILTTLLGIQFGDLSATVTLSSTAGDIPDDSSTIPLDIGENINFRDLLFATMVRSGNEGANLIAESVSGSMEAFVELMNQAVSVFELTNTNFANASGLHHNDHFSTVRDMAKIARIAMEDELFREIARTYSYSLPRSNLYRKRVLTSSADALLNPNIEENEYYYEYATGIKTGYHARAGYCYVGSAQKEGVELISVVFYTSRTGRWTDTKKLMEYGFSQFVSVTPEEMYNQSPIIIETSGFSMDDPDVGRLTLEIRPTEGTRTVHIVDTRAAVEDMARNLKQNVIIEYQRDFTAPITQGETFGTLTYRPTDGGTPVTYELVASRSVERRLNAPKSIEEIEAEVYADPNPFPALSAELVVVLLAPVVLLFVLVRVLMRLFRRSGRYKKGRIPKPGNRYFR